MFKMDGQLTIIDLNECDKNLVKDKDALERFTIRLSEIIEMEREGRPIIKRFGKGKLRGYTAIQLIQTSNIIVHLDEYERKVFIDIFSCKEFDAVKAKQFSQQFFNAGKAVLKTIIRK
jgi:S-adenosylmethionine/arginine decarboxylase-like enzyme